MDETHLKGIVNFIDDLLSLAAIMSLNNVYRLESI